MAASMFDSAIYGKLFATGEAQRLFSDSAEVRAMLLVEGALAKVQGSAGVIPETSAAAIHRAALEIQLDPAGLAEATGRNGVPVPALVEAFRAAMNAPEHAQFVHWGATSQDIMDSALMLRLRQALTLCETDLTAILGRMAEMAEAHADTPMAARTYGQAATPTTWGAVVAQWGNPLADARAGLSDLRARSLWVSLSGAAGTASALGPDPAGLRAALAEALGLEDPNRTWHTDRGPVLRIATWMMQVVATLGGMGETLLALLSSETRDVVLGTGGASSTMPQKDNPITASALVALARQAAALGAGLHSSASHAHQRDGSAWFTEWLMLPQIVLGTAAALRIADNLLLHIQPETTRMQDKLAADQGTIHAEAVSFALATQMRRPDAQAVTKSLCNDAILTKVPLLRLTAERYPKLSHLLVEAGTALGTAPAEARAFAARVRSG